MEGGPPGRPPERLVDRPQLVAAAKAALLQGRGARVVGLVGMAGAGSSTLAGVVAGDPEVRAWFPGGVVRLRLGPSADLVVEQARLAGLLGDARPVIDVRHGLERLNGLLAGGRLLLVLDDVADRDGVGAFRVRDPSCALLVATSDRGALGGVAVPVPVGPLSDGQAGELLAAAAGLDPAVLPAEAAGVARACGGLALALELAGGLAADGYGWAEVLERLGGVDPGGRRARHRGHPRPDLLGSLDVSVAALAPGDRARYLELAVFDGHGPTPTEVVRWWWAQAGLEERDAGQLLARLARRRLVRQDPGDGTVTVHQLQLAAASRQLGRRRLRGLHARLADGYLAAWGGLEQALPRLRERARVGPVDRYGLTHLVRHLAAAGRANDVHRLLALEWAAQPVGEAAPARAGNAWWLAVERVAGSGGYLGDVRVAGRLAAAAADRVLARGAPAAMVGQEVRHAVAAASVVSVAGAAANPPGPLLAALVAAGLWPPGRAAAAAQQLPVPPAAKALALLGLVPRLPTLERDAVLAAVIRLAGVVDDEDDRQAVLYALLAADLPASLLGAALRLCFRLDSAYWWEQALAVLGPHLPASVRAEALALTRGMRAGAHGVPGAYHQARALGTLAPYLPEPERQAVLAEALGLARTLAGDAERPHLPALALEVLAPQLPADLLPQALELAHAIDDPGRRARALAAVAPYLAASDRDTGLTDALDLPRQAASPYRRADLLATLAPHLPAGQVHDALDLARTLEEVGYRAWVLDALAQRLPEPERTAALAEALALVRVSGDPGERAQALQHLVPHLPADLLPAALELTATIDRPHPRALVLRLLVPRLAEPERRAALTAALALAPVPDDPEELVQLLAFLAPHLPADLLPAALQLAGTIEEPDPRALPLAFLAPHLPAELLPAALQQVGALPAYARAPGLAALAPQLPAELLPAALELARSLVPSHRGEALGALAPHLPADLLPTALELTRAVEDQGPLAEALAALAPHLLDEPDRRTALADALGLARAGPDPGAQARTLAAVAPYLPDQERQAALAEALGVVPTLDHPASRADLLEALAPHLPADLLPAALDALPSLAGFGWWFGCRALQALVPRLPAGLLRQALDLARTVDLPVSQVKALAAVAPHLPALERQAALAEALALARRIDDRGWHAEALAALAPHLPAPDRRAALAEVLALARGLDGARQQALLVDLAPHLPAGLVGGAVQIAGTIRERLWRARALAALAPHRPAPDQQPALAQALDLVLGLEPGYDRDDALLALVPHLPSDLLRVVLDHTIRTTAGWGWPVLRALVQAPGAAGLGWADWRPALTAATAHGRPALAATIAAISPVLARFAGPAGVRACQQALADATRWWP